MKICSVIGARPQFVKAGVVSRAILARTDLQEVLVHTGQHYDVNMSDVFFRELALPAPTHNLGVGSGRHGAQTARMLEGLEQIFLDEQPDVVLIYGDTNSTLAAAVAAAKLHLPIAHVEAGLRSFNRRMPEETNRVVADALSDVLFAPTEDAVRQLRREGHAEDRIVWSGDVMYDAALLMKGVAASSSRILDDHSLVERDYFLATVHRAENTDDPARLRSIFDALELVARQHAVVLPLHPRTRAALQRDGLFDRASSTLRLIDPLGFIDMVRLEMGALAVATDSGGLQKEAFFHGVPCFVLREETEWTELVTAGWNTLVPPGDPARMAAAMLSAPHERAAITPYGDGRASELIVRHLVERYGPRAVS
ncbi:MAG: UDP-N-acetylglucosamine 2-epimerase (non-hydrolyzing) [bacterium]